MFRSSHLDEHFSGGTIALTRALKHWVLYSTQLPLKKNINYYFMHPDVILISSEQFSFFSVAVVCLL